MAFSHYTLSGGLDWSDLQNWSPNMSPSSLNRGLTYCTSHNVNEAKRSFESATYDSSLVQSPSSNVSCKTHYFSQKMLRLNCSANCAEIRKLAWGDGKCGLIAVILTSNWPRKSTILIAQAAIQRGGNKRGKIKALVTGNLCLLIHFHFQPDFPIRKLTEVSKCDLGYISKRYVEPFE